ncbi:hypothetical protein DY000_02051269 [Brassica cretica]|uniref:Uncharacterized protein n=1 Tax=Brassica cretica TaxID=69181 RepID=A0ABQ7F4Y5_BRACR|nr:hypothetical protein DY000_02051269 [Brassica cretica]
MPGNEYGERIHNFFGQEGLSQDQHQSQVVDGSWSGYSNGLGGNQKQIDTSLIANLKSYSTQQSDDGLGFRWIVQVLVDCSGDDNAEKTPETAFQYKKAALLLPRLSSSAIRLKVENIFKRLDRNEKAAARSTVSRSTRTRGKAYKHGRIHLISSRRSFTVSEQREGLELKERLSSLWWGTTSSVGKEIIERNQKGHPVHDVPNAYEFITWFKTNVSIAESKLPRNVMRAGILKSFISSP